MAWNSNDNDNNNNKDDNDNNKNKNKSSNNGSTPRLDSKEMQQALKNRKEEALLFERFKRVATTKLERMANEVQSDQSDGDNNSNNNNSNNTDNKINPRYTMGEKEKEIFQKLQGMGVKEGMFATVLAFVTLRRGPIYVARWVQRRKMIRQQQQQQPSTSATPFTNTTSTTTTPPTTTTSGYQLSDPNKVAFFNPFARMNNNYNNNGIGTGPEFPRSRSFIIRSIWFMFDSVLSLMLGASISMAYTDTDQIRDQLVELPLVPGRSLTSDALCKEIIQELQKVQDEQDPAYVRITKEYFNNNNTYNHNHNKTSSTSPKKLPPAAIYLQGIIGFAENCQRRHFLERQLRQERGLQPTDPIEIPEPGVSKFGPRLIQKIKRKKNNDNDNYNGHNDGNGDEEEEEEEEIIEEEMTMFGSENKILMDQEFEDLSQQQQPWGAADKDD